MARYRLMLAAGFKVHEIADYYGVSRQAVSQATSGRVGRLLRDRTHRARLKGGELQPVHCGICGVVGHNRQSCAVSTG